MKTAINVIQAKQENNRRYKILRNIRGINKLLNRL